MRRAVPIAAWLAALSLTGCGHDQLPSVEPGVEPPHGEPTVVSGSPTCPSTSGHFEGPPDQAPPLPEIPFAYPEVAACIGPSEHAEQRRLVPCSVKSLTAAGKVDRERTFDDRGNVIFERVSTGPDTWFEYDDANRLTRRYSQLGDEIRWIYAEGELLEEVSRWRDDWTGTPTVRRRLYLRRQGRLEAIELHVDGELKHRSEHRYDAMGRLFLISDGSSRTTFSYHGGSKVVARETHVYAGQQSESVFDEHGRLTLRTSPEMTHQFAYPEEGRTDSVYRSQSSTGWTEQRTVLQEVEGRIAQRWYVAASQWTDDDSLRRGQFAIANRWTYACTGELLKMERDVNQDGLAEERTEYSYDPSGNLLQVQQFNGCGEAIYESQVYDYACRNQNP